MKKHLERVWDDIVNLLEDEFPLPIQIPTIPSVKNCQVVLLVKPLLYHLCVLLKIYHVLILVKPL